MITPGMAKMILMSCAASHGPNTPCKPNSSTKTMPPITGDTENGRSTMAMSRVRAPPLSVSGNGQRAACGAFAPQLGTSSTTLLPPGPRLQQVDGQQQDEGCHQHQARHHGCARVIELLELDDDEQRNDLGIAGHIAGNEDDGAVLPDPACKGEREPGHYRGNERRKHDAAQDIPTRGAEKRACLLGFAAKILQHRLHGSYDEWQANEG